MIRLIRTELYRWSGRTLLWVLAAATVAFAVIVPLNAWTESRPPSQQDYERAQDQLEQQQQMMQEQLDSCLEGQEAEREATGDPTLDWGCEWEPRVEDFLPWRQYFDTEAESGVAGMAIVLVLAGVLMGASFVAAEFSTGAIGNWLTFAPRRGRVLTSKLTATALGYLPTVVVATVVLVGGSWLGFRLNDAMQNPSVYVDEAGAGPDLMTPANLTLMGLRIVAVAIAMAVAGAALGFLLRHTAAVLGVLLGWAVLVEGFLRVQAPKLQPYTLAVNLDAWVRGGTQYGIERCEYDADNGGTMCETIYHDVSQAHGAVVLGIVLVVLVGLAALVFRRRDVS
ncbi:ABC transporter permease subunit [Cellulomonas sp. DKR-3]|uniref:ABC transporter permease subunit n=1 Tax=Cellulomonas fulva TaxID=2835530 RepID=A0ABS5U240_9CELL|nr:ABC transporter permease subunit [Cellulomonas fulva]MBT0995381.1 ABC transporter permease subunit [Cellulomonas fulva]